MNNHPFPPASTSTAYKNTNPPYTWRGLALYFSLIPLFVLTLFAIENPVVVAASVVGLSAGLLTRPLHHRLTRRENQSTRSERPSNTVGTTAARD